MSRDHFNQLHLKRSNGATEIATQYEWAEGKYHYIPTDAELISLINSTTSKKQRDWLEENFGERLAALAEKSRKIRDVLF